MPSPNKYLNVLFESFMFWLAVVLGVLVLVK